MWMSPKAGKVSIEKRKENLAICKLRNEEGKEPRTAFWLRIPGLILRAALYFRRKTSAGCFLDRDVILVYGRAEG
jgi:hypothetical protein